ncbi:coiled-coil domain-containing protein 86 [Hemiscyllium ocellatum]|uniref:coiled-coil domain-containing protein 86 n=1 Tax=Hemiscyllium ocellatum TaxID=170820 RepID=UPI002966728A|nr:coiled-coil domain-containing protein 86 [Hemiscyllium ocellatum]
MRSDGREKMAPARKQKCRFSDLLRDKPLRTSWEVKMAMKRERVAVRELAQRLHGDRVRAKEEKRLRREENERRRLVNQRRAEVVEVVTNPVKIKRLRKKQLRKIEKRDTLKILQKNDLKRQQKALKSGEN